MNKKLLGILGIGAGLAALVGGGIAIAKTHTDEAEVDPEYDEDYEADDEDEDDGE